MIFDECTSGLENNLLGFVKYGVEPDIAVYGKTLRNDYTVSAVVGCESVMQSAQSTFISSTFWTERIGSVTALKTLEVEKEEPWEHAMAMGHYMRLIWQQVAENNNIEIKISGLPAISSFSINSNNALAYKTLITQESLKYGYLAGNLYYGCKAHKREIITSFADKLNDIFKLIDQCENGLDVNTILQGSVCHSGFKRLN